MAGHCDMPGHGFLRQGMEASFPLDKIILWGFILVVNISTVYNGSLNRDLKFVPIICEFHSATNPLDAEVLSVCAGQGIIAIFCAVALFDEFNIKYIFVLIFCIFCIAIVNITSNVIPAVRVSNLDSIPDFLLSTMHQSTKLFTYLKPTRGTSCGFFLPDQSTKALRPLSVPGLHKIRPLHSRMPFWRR